MVAVAQARADTKLHLVEVNGCNEIIIDNQNGIIIPKQDDEALYNAMQRLASDRELTKTLAASARELVATRYAQAEVWRATLEMYNSLPEK